MMRLPCHLTVFRLLGKVLLTLFVSVLVTNAQGAPAPKPNVYALLYIPKKGNDYETIRNRRSQITSIKSRFTLYTAIRSLKDAPLPSLPNKGKGQGEMDDHEDDVVWIGQNLKVEYLDGTGVLRISLAAGSLREQALLVNAVARAYLKDVVCRDKKNYERGFEGLKKNLDIDQQRLLLRKARADKVKVEREIELIKTEIKRVEFELQTLPQLLELADVPKD